MDRWSFLTTGCLLWGISWISSFGGELLYCFKTSQNINNSLIQRMFDTRFCSSNWMLLSQPKMRSGFFGRIAYPLAVENRTMHEETDGKRVRCFQISSLILQVIPAHRIKQIKLERSLTITIDTLYVFSRYFPKQKFLHHACQVPAPIFLLTLFKTKLLPLHCSRL